MKKQQDDFVKFIYIVGKTQVIVIHFIIIIIVYIGNVDGNG